jgi:hypothetical protein
MIARACARFNSEKTKGLADRVLRASNLCGNLGLLQAAKVKPRYFVSIPPINWNVHHSLRSWLPVWVARRRSSMPDLISFILTGGSPTKVRPNVVGFDSIIVSGVMFFGRWRPVKSSAHNSRQIKCFLSPPIKQADAKIPFNPYARLNISADIAPKLSTHSANFATVRNFVISRIRNWHPTCNHAACNSAAALICASSAVRHFGTLPFTVHA